MKIGFANIFAFRPHVEHLLYLAQLLRRAGHQVYFLTCDSSVTNCYPRAIKGTSKLIECPKCILGGVRSYATKNVTSISTMLSNLDLETLDGLALSSSCTITRTESETEWMEPAVAATRATLHAPISMTYQSTMHWIKQHSLDAVVCFNGRMDLTRAVTFACEHAQIPYVTHERTWTGNGIHLTPNANCLSLKALNEMGSDFRGKPLTKDQVRIAAKMAAERFLQRNSLEWRVYNRNPEPAAWPLQSDRPRVLILPSSKNEFAGHAEWQTGWPDNTQALDDFFEAFSISPSQVVLRCHPNWSERIGIATGERSLSLYKSWARRKGVFCISSEEKANTYDLIQQADIVVMNGGSSAVEAGVCGKQVICLGPSPYQSAGFVRTFTSRDDLYGVGAMDQINSTEVVRMTLRYLYLRSHRFSQYVDHVRAIETTRYAYYEGADPERLVNMFRTGQVHADDASYADDSTAEEEIIRLLNERNWATLADYNPPRKQLPPLRIERRAGLKWIDTVRSLMPRGDRG